MENNIRRRDETEINLLEIIGYLMPRSWVLLLCGMICAVLAALYTMFCVIPMYTTNTSMYVMNRQSDSVITTSDISSSTSLTNDYMELIKSRTVLETVIEDLNLDMTYKTLLSNVSVSTKSNTRVMVISVANPDPELACKIANELREIAAKRIQEVMKVEMVSVVDEAFVPANPSSPNLKENVVIAAIAGIVMSTMVYVISYLMNDKISTVEHVEKYLGLSVIGVLPVDEIAIKAKTAGKKNRKRK